MDSMQRVIFIDCLLFARLNTSHFSIAREECVPLAEVLREACALQVRPSI